MDRSATWKYTRSTHTNTFSAPRSTISARLAHETTVSRFCSVPNTHIDHRQRETNAKRVTKTTNTAINATVIYFRASDNESVSAHTSNKYTQLSTAQTPHSVREAKCECISLLLFWLTFWWALELPRFQTIRSISVLVIRPECGAYVYLAIVRENVNSYKFYKWRLLSRWDRLLRVGESGIVRIVSDISVEKSASVAACYKIEWKQIAWRCQWDGDQEITRYSCKLTLKWMSNAFERNVADLLALVLEPALVEHEQKESTGGQRVGWLNEAVFWVWHWCILHPLAEPKCGIELLLLLRSFLRL